MAPYQTRHQLHTLIKKKMIAQPLHVTSCVFFPALLCVEKTTTVMLAWAWGMFQEKANG